MSVSWLTGGSSGEPASPAGHLFPHTLVIRDTHPRKDDPTMRALLALMALMLLIAPLAADAQLVVVNKRYKVVALNPSKSIITVVPADKDPNDAKNTSDVIVTNETRMFVFDKQIPNFSWRLLRKGMTITVHGGATWDMNVKAKKIYLISTNAPG